MLPVPPPTTPFPPPPLPPQHHDEDTVVPDAPPAEESATASAGVNTDSDDSPDTDKSGFNGTAATVTDETPPSVSVRTATTPGSASACLTTPSPRDVRDHTSNHYHYSPKVVYGAGAVSRLPTELGRLHLVCPLIVSSPSRISLARRIQGLIPNLDSRILDSALVNVPQHVVDDAVFRITGRDCVISVGGTSAVALAKSIAARKDIPHICIPTTYSGSEHPTQDHARRLERKESRRKRSGSSSKSPTSTASTSKSPNANKSPVSSKSPGGSSHHSRRSEIKSRPTIIIYDEDLTATDTPTHFSVPNDDKIPAKPRYRYSEDDENAQWSYIHLPGV